MSTDRSELTPRLALDDVAVLVPVRIDSPDRLRNLDLALAWLERCFEGAQTLVLEHDAAPKADDVARRHGAEHVFLRSDGCFHKSRVFNLGLALAERPFALLYDCDVLVPAAAIAEAVARLRCDEADYVYPYNGVMLEVRCDDDDPLALLASSLLRGDAPCTGAALEAPPAGAAHLNGSVVEPSTGGALACRRRALLLHGGFNPNIVSYGCEDTELESRVVKLGARVARLPRYNCFHVHHRRGLDSRYNGFHAANLAEWKKVEAMTTAEVSAYVQNGFRALRLDASHGLEIVDTAHRFSMTLTSSSARPLLDVAFLVMLDADPPVPPGLVTALIDDLETEYLGYEIHLVERDGYRYRSVSHRDHVVYEAVRDESDMATLRRLVMEIDRPRLCVCSVFLDPGVDVLGATLEALRGGTSKARELALSDTSKRSDSRADRVVAVLRARLGSRARSFAFDRAELLAWLERAAPLADDARWDEILTAARSEMEKRRA